MDSSSTLPCELSLVRQGNVSHHQFTFALSFLLKTFFFAGLKLLTSLSDNLHRDLPFLHSHLSLLELQMQSGLLLQLLLHARYRAGNATHPEDWKKYYSWYVCCATFLTWCYPDADVTTNM